MTINKALLKYGYSATVVGPPWNGGGPQPNFTALQPPSAAAAASGALEILEYCAPEDTIKREQHYLDLLKPEYNILKIAGSSFGYKHTETTLAKLRGRTHSEETRSKLSKSRIGTQLSEETRAKLSLLLKGVGGLEV